MFQRRTSLQSGFLLHLRVMKLILRFLQGEAGTPCLSRASTVCSGVGGTFDSRLGRGGRCNRWTGIFFLTIETIRSWWHISFPRARLEQEGMTLKVSRAPSLTGSLRKGKASFHLLHVTWRLTAGITMSGQALYYAPLALTGLILSKQYIFDHQI